MDWKGLSSATESFAATVAAREEVRVLDGFISPSCSAPAHPEEQGQIEVLNAKACQRNPHRVPIPRAGRDGNLHRVLRYQGPVPLAAPALVEAYRPSPAAFSTSGPRWNPHTHTAPKPRLFRANHHLYRQAFQPLCLGPAPRLKVAPEPVEQLLERRGIGLERFQRRQLPKPTRRFHLTERLSRRTLARQRLGFLVPPRQGLPLAEDVPDHTVADAQGPPTRCRPPAPPEMDRVPSPTGPDGDPSPVADKPP